jgi:hypothetical protein
VRGCFRARHLSQAVFLTILVGCGGGGGGGSGGNKSSSSSSVQDTTRPTDGAALTATAGTNQVALSWPAGSDNVAVSAYKIYQSTNGGLTYNSGSNAGNTTSHTVTGLTNGINYTFKVTALDAAGNESTGISASATPIDPDTTAPSGPTNLNVSPGNTVLYTSWTAATDNVAVSYYNVRLSTDGTTYGSATNVGNVTSYTVTGLTNGVLYYVKVTAVDTSGNESSGVVGTGTPSTTVDTTAPNNVTNLQATPGNTQISLTWTASTSTDVDHYNVYASTNGGATYGSATNVGTATSYTLTGLTNGTNYTIKVTAVDGPGNESSGTTTSATPGSDLVKVNPNFRGGAYNDTFTLTLTLVGASGGDIIYYTTDGSNPSTSSTSGASPLTVTPNPIPVGVTTVKYFGVRSGVTGLTKSDKYEIVSNATYPANSFYKFSGIRQPRFDASVTLSTSAGKVLVAGGTTPTGTVLDDGEYYHNTYEHFEDTTNDMPARKHKHQATLLQDNNTVLITGGQYDTSIATTTSATCTFSWVSSTFSVGPDLAVDRTRHTSTRLFDGKVLLTGGVHGQQTFPSTSTSTACTNATPSKTLIYDDGETFTGILIGDIVEIMSGAATGAIGVVTNVTQDGAGTGSDFLTVTDLTVDVSVNDTYRILKGRQTGAEEFNSTGTTTTVTGSMNVPRYGHTATLLQDGKVFIAGGWYDYKSDPNDPTEFTTEIYDPDIDIFRYAASPGWPESGYLLTSRFFHTATLLEDGKVLICGGIDRGDGDFISNGWSGTILSSAQVFDPVNETMTTVGSLNRASFAHTATLLASGKVLITGGVESIVNGADYIYNTAEIYDPTTRAFTMLENIGEQRGYHSAVLLPNNKVLIADGSLTDYAEVFEEDKSRFVATAHCMTKDRRFGPVATMLADGNVLVTGGQGHSVQGSPGPYHNTGEVYSMSSIQFNLPTSTMADTRRYHTGTLLDTGKVLIAGGENGSGRLSSTALYDPDTETFTGTGIMSVGRYRHTAVKLNPTSTYTTGSATFTQGSTTVTGTGTTWSGNVQPTWIVRSDADGTFYVIASVDSNTQLTLTAAYKGVTSSSPEAYTTQTQSKVLIAGGDSLSGALATAELYDPATGTFSTTGALNVGRFDHTATLLTDGTVLLAGGDQIFDVTGEIYYPSTGTFTSTSDTLAQGRDGHSAVRLSNGDVLIVGGEVTNTVAEFYDFSAGTFETITAATTQGRYGHTANELDGGRVLIAGGDNGANAETFNYSGGDPTGDSFTARTMDPSTDPWSEHMAIKLPSGETIILWGHGAQMYFDD